MAWRKVWKSTTIQKEEKAVSPVARKKLSIEGQKIMKISLLEDKQNKDVLALRSGMHDSPREERRKARYHTRAILKP
jgi:hypothetical protein